MLIGEYKHTIDDKNRLSLPAKFRKEMGKKVVIAPGLDQCLFIFTAKEWGVKARDLVTEDSILHSDRRSFNRRMFGGAFETEVDSNGSILVPDFLRVRAKLESKVAFIGGQDRVEIWNDSLWDEYKAKVEVRAEELAEKLGAFGGNI